MRNPILPVLAVASFVVFALSGSLFDAGRPDFFYLADAFLHGRTWLDVRLGAADVIVEGSRIYVPFAPFPAIALMPLVALVGPELAASWQPLVNGGLAATSVVLVWVLAGRLGVASPRDRFWLAVLFGFSTQIWWVTTRGGVWHTGHLVAAVLTLLALVEGVGSRRPVVLGLLVGAAFLSRAPLALAIPYFAWLVLERRADREERGLGGAVARLRAIRSWPWGALARYALAVLPAIAFFLWYNADRFGSPFTSGYGEATLNSWLARQRALGLFSLAHLPMNLDYLFVRIPAAYDRFPWFRPDGLGMSILLTSPGLLLAVLADWRRPTTIALGLTALAVLVPSLLYYGGGWYQYGYRYALDSIPFVVALCALAAARHGMGARWRLLILFGVVVGAGGLYWAVN